VADQELVPGIARVEWLWNRNRDACDFLPPQQQQQRPMRAAR